MSDQQPKSEMFMKFVKKDSWQGGGPVWAECAADKRPDNDDDWMTDFNPQPYDDFSDFFEITKFEFGVDVKPEDTSKTGPQTQRPLTQGMQGHGALGGKAGVQHASSGDAWQSWRSANSDSDVDNLKYPFDVDKFQFERIIDRGSLTLFEACCGSQTFKSAAFVKRVWTGSLADYYDNKPGKSFIRIDFQDVMVTSINWDDGDMLNETCEFICRGFKLQYRRQRADGTLLEPVSAEWHYKTDALGKKNGK
ncbi:MAG: type VI secretion system tube protein Hcp [Acetobacteraceae bacterium]|nr:type VI secretion system tube protein Hcp [Acetobacteraceae bacterium]